MLIQELLNIWEQSVRASHFFLTETDIQRISVQAEDALWQISVLVTAENEEGCPVAFMNIWGFVSLTEWNVMNRVTRFLY